MFGGDALEFDGDLGLVLGVEAVVDFAEGAGVDFLEQAVDLADFDLHGERGIGLYYRIGIVDDIVSNREGN